MANYEPPTIRVELNPKTILIATADDRKNLCKIFAAATGGCFRSLTMFAAIRRAPHVPYSGRSEPRARRIVALHDCHPELCRYCGFAGTHRLSWNYGDAPSRRGVGQSSR